jgi:hypothetical protein
MILKNTELVKTGHRHTQFQIEQIHVANDMARYPFPAAVASISEPDSIKFHAMLRQFDCGFTHSAVATSAAPFPITTLSAADQQLHAQIDDDEQHRALPHDTSTRAAGRTPSRYARQQQLTAPQCQPRTNPTDAAPACRADAHTAPPHAAVHAASHCV